MLCFYLPARRMAERWYPSGPEHRWQWSQSDWSRWQSEWPAAAYHGSRGWSKSDWSGWQYEGASASDDDKALSVWEREPTVLDTITEVNSLMDPEAFENQEEFSIEFWMATLTITGLIVFFGIGIVYACIHENTAEQLKERRRKMHKMFLKDGYINTYQLRHAEAETATMCRLLLFAFQRSHIAVSTVTALLPFNCKNWKRARKMLRIELPAAARVMLLTMKVITPCTNPEPCP